MKTITLEQTYDLFDKNTAIRVVGHYMDYAAMNTKGIVGEDDTQFMFISWTDYDGRVFDISFLEKYNKEVRIEGERIYPKDEYGDEVDIEIMKPINIEKLF
jgi:hypothetical protein